MAWAEVDAFFRTYVSDFILRDIEREIALGRGPESATSLQATSLYNMRCRRGTRPMRTSACNNPWSHQQCHSE